MWWGLTPVVDFLRHAHSTRKPPTFPLCDTRCNGVVLLALCAATSGPDSIASGNEHWTPGWLFGYLSSTMQMSTLGTTLGSCHYTEQWTVVVLEDGYLDAMLALRQPL